MENKQLEQLTNDETVAKIEKPSTITEQYDNFSENYSKKMKIQDEIGNKRFYEILMSVDLTDKNILDVGCGDGTDLSKFKEMGAIPFGVEPSEEFVNSAKEKNPDMVIEKGVGEKLPFEDKFFDIVVSKYAMQTSPNVPKIFEEVARVLKSEGYFVFLSKHPFRQFLEKINTHKRENKEGGVDYFEQEIVDSFIFEKTIHLKEPSHILSEYFSPEILKDFDLQDFREEKDFPASEQIDGMTYPTFFVVKYQRRKE